jgi:hypothetical protein
MPLEKSEIESLKKIIENENMQLTSLLPKKTFANRHKATRGKKPTVFKKMIEIMYETGNSWETGKTTVGIAMQLYDHFEKDVEEARRLGAKVRQDEEYAKFIIHKYCFKTQQQIAFARTRLAEKLKELSISQNKPFIPYYSGKASPKIYFKKGSNSLGDKITESRYFWHTDNHSLEELRTMFKKLRDNFDYRIKQINEIKSEPYIEEKIQIGLLKSQLENQRKRRKVET